MLPQVPSPPVEYFEMKSLDDQPVEIIQMLKKADNKQAKFHEVDLDILKKNVNLPIRPATIKAKENVCDDGVNAYTQELLTLNLIWAKFEDAIREGDGLRVEILLNFKAANRTNYSKEALNLLVQYHVLFLQQCEQLL